MFFNNVAIPMRSQPFHKGHEYYLKKISQICKNGIIFLNRKSDTFSNPFPFELRFKWIEKFLTSNNIYNLSIARRDLGSNITKIAKKKYEEYRSFFNEDNFIVFTTDENDDWYREQGFLHTYNMHDPTPKMIFWHDMPENFDICSNGRLIRRKLSLGRDISDLISDEVYKDIINFFQTNKHKQKPL